MQDMDIIGHVAEVLRPWTVLALGPEIVQNRKEGGGVQ